MFSLGDLAFTIHSTNIFNNERLNITNEESLLTDIVEPKKKTKVKFKRILSTNTLHINKYKTIYK